MKTKKIFSAALAFFALIFIVSGSYCADAAENNYTYRSDYLYDMLETDTEKQFYDDLTASCEKVDKSYDRYNSIDRVKIPNTMDNERALEIMVMFINDNPNYFWLDINYTILTRVERLRLQRYMTINVIDYFKDGNVRQSAKVKVMKAAQEYIDGALKLKTQYERALYLHDKLVSEVEYKLGEWDQTTASVFLEKQSVCAGYSKAYAMLCNAVGIDAIVVTSSSHAWNIIKLSGYWFIVDVTNDYNSKKFFLVSDSSIAYIDKFLPQETQHSIDKNTYVHYYDSFPKCPYNYFDIASSLSEETHILGDANNDGNVNVRDVAYIAKYLSHRNVSIIFDQADYDRDGKITVRDAAALAKDLAAA